MKQNLYSAGLVLFHVFLLIISSNSHTSARKLASKQGEADVKINIGSKSVVEMENIDSFTNLMGVEESCHDEDEECIKRRVIAEAHLDYIYTQRHKP